MPRSRVLSGRRKPLNTRKQTGLPWPLVFLTAYPDYSLDAWNTEAAGFMVKPLTPEGFRAQLRKLRYPFLTGGTEA